ncbi:MAG: hypothetical protein IT428_26290 [Planctomycetaceae bacterium]|nr:hypothetical protein [Planctomycetaceae bacterium]
MIAVKRSGQGVELGTLPEIPGLWREWVGENPHRWKRLACLTLATAGWTYDQIGALFGHQRGVVSRLVLQARQGIEAIRPAADERTESPPAETDVA